MVYFVGVVCGGFGLVEPPGYELNSSERLQLSRQLRGLPISVQHAGVTDAVRVADGRPSGLSGSGMRDVLAHAGVVRDGWLCERDSESLWIIFEVFDDFELVLWLLLGGHLQGLSLSHVEPGPVAVEVALCSVPARPCCFVRHVCTTFEEAFQYKADVENGKYSSLQPCAMSSSPTAPATTPESRLEAVLASLPESDRTLVQARFTEMMARVDDACAAETRAKTRLDQLVAIKETDKKMFEEQFSHLMSFLPAELQKSYAVTGETCKVLRDSAPEVLHHVGQVVKCASAHLAARSVVADREPARASKRTRSEEPEASVSTVPVSTSKMTPLQRALADTFRA